MSAAGIVLCQPFTFRLLTDQPVPTANTAARDPGWPTAPGSLEQIEAEWGDVLLVPAG